MAGMCRTVLVDPKKPDIRPHMPGISLKGLAGVDDDAAVLPFPENDLVDLPVSLSLPGSGSLLVRADHESRGRALGLLENTLLAGLSITWPARTESTTFNAVSYAVTPE